MSRKIPFEIESLMWSVAESGDQEAIEAFGERHPEYRAEMGKLLGTIRTLKASKPTSSSIPAFASPQRSSQPGGFRWAWVVATIAVAALGFGSFQIAQNVLQRSGPIAKVDPIDDSPIQLPDPIMVEPKRDPQYRVVEPTDVAPVKKDEPPRWTLPISVALKQAPLRVALEAISMQSGLTLEIMPGMPELFVDIDFVQENPLRILNEIGATVGFTAMEQEPGKILIVPAVDETSPNQKQDVAGDRVRTSEPPGSSSNDAANVDR